MKFKSALFGTVLALLAPSAGFAAGGREAGPSSSSLEAAEGAISRQTFIATLQQMMLATKEEYRQMSVEPLVRGYQILPPTSQKETIRSLDKQIEMGHRASELRQILQHPPRHPQQEDPPVAADAAVPGPRLGRGQNGTCPPDGQM